MKLIIIHGPAAAGKLTIARRLAKLTGLPLFHNHLIVDAARSVFDFGSPEFVELRHKWWMEMFKKAAEAGKSLIFTFSPENTVPFTFVDEVCDLVHGLGGEVLFVRLTISEEEQERRIGNESRAEFGKLRSVEVLKEIRRRGGSEFPPLPDSGLTIDTEVTEPDEAARSIQEFFVLPLARTG